MNDRLIKLKNIKKVYYFEDVEIHALSNINLTFKKNKYVLIDQQQRDVFSRVIADNASKLLTDMPAENSDSKKYRYTNGIHK